MPTKMPFDLLAERKRWNAGYESIDTSSQKVKLCCVKLKTWSLAQEEILSIFSV